jgi:histone-lysine N-methyltransferase SETMAR
LFFFSKWRGSFTWICSSWHCGQLLTFTVTFWDAWEETCDEKDQNNRLLRHDNAPAHMSLKTIQFVTNNNMVIIPHHPYSPDLAPCDFALFSWLKGKLNGRRFERVSDIQRELQAVLDSIKENDFHSAFEAYAFLYTFPRRLFWRRWLPTLSKLSQHFFFDLVRERSDTPRIGK